MRVATLLSIVFVHFHPAPHVARPAFPAGWLTEARCIHEHESLDWHRTTDWLGHPSRDHGGMQIDVDTWRAFGGRGDPAGASPRVQLEVAYRIWRHDGGSWREWPVSSRVCGLE